MKCKKCGAKLPKGTTVCSGCGEAVATKQPRKRPPFPIRLLLQLISLVLCLVLTVTLLATALLADALLLTSSGGIETILNHLAPPSNPDTPSVPPAMGAYGVVRLGGSNDYYGCEVDENGNIISPDGSILGNINDPDSIQIPDDVQIPEDLEIPAEALTSSGALGDFIYGLVEDALGTDIPVSLEQIKAFIEESTMMDFIAGKTASMVQDALNGTQNTTITTEEIMNLVDENEKIIEDIFQVDMTEEMKQEMAVRVEEAVVDSDINATLHESVNQVMQTEVPGTGGLTVSDLMLRLRVLLRPGFVAAAAALCLVLMLLLWGLSYYDPPRGLRWSASSCMSAGVLLSVPLALIQASPSLLAENMPETAQSLELLSGAVAVLAPVHYGLLAFGVAMLIGSFLWRVMRKI